MASKDAIPIRIRDKEVHPALWFRLVLPESTMAHVNARSISGQPYVETLVACPAADDAVRAINAKSENAFAVRE